MLKLLGLIALFAGAGVAWFGFQQVILATVLGVAAAVVYVILLREQSAESRRVNAETTSADAQLRSEVVAAQKVAFSKLASASDEFKSQVAEKIADAAMHLGYPYMNSQRIYGTGHILSWNQEGLKKIAEVRALIDGYTPPSAK
jgi:5-hydroxyisourate hydrolase-like protein (transthyretin family)